MTRTTPASTTTATLMPPLTLILERRGVSNTAERPSLLFGRPSSWPSPPDHPRDAPPAEHPPSSDEQPAARDAGDAGAREAGADGE
eukprot:2045365-Rhodomonas_salina.1